MNSGTSVGEAFNSSSFALMAARSGLPGAYVRLGSLAGLSAEIFAVILIPLLNYLTKSRGGVNLSLPNENLTP
jgi:hypothetical protein